MNPVIRFGEHLALPTWMLLISLSLSLSFKWLVTRSESWTKPIVERNAALNLVILLMMSAILGGRLFHVLYEAPMHYWNNPWALLKIWEGGFVFYGALLAMAMSLGWYCKWQKEVFLTWADFLTPILSLNYMVGRIGCFLNGCCYGKICSLPWAVEFPAHANWGLAVVSRHPTQLYAASIEVLILAILLRYEKHKSLAAGKVFFLWLALHSFGRLVMEYFRDDQRGPLFLSESISLWLSVIFLGIALWQWRKIKRRSSFQS